MSNFGAPEGATLGEMIANNSQPAPPPPVVVPPPPEIPGTASEATARLAQLQADPKWREDFLSGNGPHAKEFHSLMDVISKGDNPAIDHAIAGVLYDGPFQPSGHMQNIATAAMFRDLGIGDDVTRQVLTGHEVTQEEYNKVEQLKAERIRDQDWVAKYMAGNGPQRRDMTLMNIVLSSTIKAKAAS